MVGVMGMMDLFNQGDVRDKLYAAAAKSNVPQGGITGKLFSAMFPHGLGNLAFGREPEPMPPLETPEGTALMADLASNMMVPGTFIGPKGLARLFGDDAAKGILATAESKLASGVPKEAVFQELGVFKGPEGKWRYEIDDSGAKSRRGTDGERTTASKAIKHDEFFLAYPDAADMNVSYTNAMRANGEHGRNRFDDSEFIRINPQTSDDSTLLHELQHAVQEREDFARGGNFDMFMPQGKSYTKGNVKEWLMDKEVAHRDYLRLAGEAEAREAEKRMYETITQRRASFPRYATRDDLIIHGLMSGVE